jgi:CheY-like chemotaxis protein
LRADLDAWRNFDEVHDQLTGMTLSVVLGVVFQRISCSLQLPTGYPFRILAAMARATFLIIEKEQPEGLSSRKLVVETAKYNVLTAYSAKEGLEIFREHPVTAVVLHASVDDMPCDAVVKTIKTQQPDVPVILLSATGLDECKPADKVIGSHNPEELLRALQTVLAA